MVAVHPVERPGDLLGERLQPPALVLDIGDVPGLEDHRLDQVVVDRPRPRRGPARRGRSRAAAARAGLAYLGTYFAGRPESTTTPAKRSGWARAVIPGHVAARELAGDEDAVAVDGVALARVAQGQFDGGVLAGRVAIVVGLAGQVVLGGDEDVTVPRGLGGPLVDGRRRDRGRSAGRPAPGSCGAGDTRAGGGWRTRSARRSRPRARDAAWSCRRARRGRAAAGA